MTRSTITTSSPMRRGLWLSLDDEAAPLLVVACAGSGPWTLTVRPVRWHDHWVAWLRAQWRRPREWWLNTRCLPDDAWCWRKATADERADCGCCDRVTTSTGTQVAVADMDDAPHIAANSPAAVLARIEAERGILEACDTVLSGWYFGETKELARDVIRGLAAGWGWEAGA